MDEVDKQIPVTEERWRALTQLKEDGQTYDELIEELIHEHEYRQFAGRAKKVREVDSDELTSINEIPLR